MAEKVLNVTLNKSYHLRCSDWEAETLTEAQVSMAQQCSIPFNFTVMA